MQTSIRLHTPITEQLSNINKKIYRNERGYNYYKCYKGHNYYKGYKGYNHYKTTINVGWVLGKGTR